MDTLEDIDPVLAAHSFDDRQFIYYSYHISSIKHWGAYSKIAHAQVFTKSTPICVILK